jgi:hypothetical protein
MPDIDGKPHWKTVDSLLAEQLFCSQVGVHLLVEWEVGCSLIGDARNKLAKRFLARKECREMVFVDADISWPPGSLHALVKTRKDVIGGTYRPKQDEVRFHIHGKVERRGPLYSVGGLPGGFIKIGRRAFNRMIPKAKAYLASDDTVTHDFFPMGFYRGTYYGEDYGFCRLWRQCGGEVFLDPRLRVRHHEAGHVYEGDPHEWLRSRDGAVNV